MPEACHHVYASFAIFKANSWLNVFLAYELDNSVGTEKNTSAVSPTAWPLQGDQTLQQTIKSIFQMPQTLTEMALTTSVSSMNLQFQQPHSYF